METVPQNSLMEIPTEIRLNIYRYLFRDTELLLDIKVDRSGYPYEYFSSPLGSKATIDGGITLTSRAVRAETLPVLRESLSLRYELSFRDPLDFPAREYGTPMVSKKST